uniref:Uncharacterized protein n=1 Tax=Arundo donax TaxID=35708 RepID=A0A0A9CNC2_ARUDO
MAKSTFAELPLDLVLGRSSHLDRVGEGRGVGFVFVVGGGGGVVGAETTAVGHPPRVAGVAVLTDWGWGGVGFLLLVLLVGPCGPPRHHDAKRRRRPR